MKGLPPEFEKSVPTEVALERMDFTMTPLGGYENQIGPVKFSAASVLYGWAINALYVTPDTYGQPEVVIQNKIAPVELASVLYLIWQDAGGTPPVPQKLEYGRIYLDMKKNLRKLIPPSPSLWVEREFFRFCLGYIEKHNDWTEKDYDVRFSYHDKQIKITAKDLILYCPARGNWLGSVWVSAKQLFHKLPKRFLGNHVVLTAGAKTIVIASHVLPARWQDGD